MSMPRVFAPAALSSSRCSSPGLPSLGPAAVAVVALFMVVPAVRADLDPYLPADTESYVSINVRQMLDSSIIKKNALEPLRDLLKGSDEINDVLKELGFDPFKDLDRVIMASPTSTDTDRGLIIAQGTFDVKKFKAKAADAAQNNSESLTIHKVKLGPNVTHEIYEVAIPIQDMTLFVAVASNKVLIASPGKDYVVDALKQVHLKKKPALKNKAFQATLEKMDPKQSLSFAALGKTLAGVKKYDFVPKAVVNALNNVDVIGGGLTFGNDVKLQLAISSKDETSARRTREIVGRGVNLAIVGLALLGDENKGINLLMDVLKTIRVGGQGKMVSVAGRLSADVLGDFFKNDD